MKEQQINYFNINFKFILKNFKLKMLIKFYILKGNIIRFKSYWVIIVVNITMEIII